MITMVLFNAFTNIRKAILALLVGLIFIQFSIAQNCYVANSGEKYHCDESCGYLKSKNIIAFEEAKKRGYTSCSAKKCKAARTKIENPSYVQSYGSSSNGQNLPAISSKLITSGRYLEAPSGSIKTLTWNLKDLGRTKDAIEIDAIIQVLRYFDLVAIQEVVAGDHAGKQRVAAIEDGLDRTGSNWHYSCSEGTNSPSSGISERYAYFWKASKLTPIVTPKLDESLAHTCDREPYIAGFRTKDHNIFYTVNFHARTADNSPDLEVQEFSAYPERLNSENVVILGDFNMNEDNSAWYGLYKQDFEPSIRNSHTTLKEKCTSSGYYLLNSYDNIYINTSKMKIEDAGRIDIVGSCGNLETARGISDHLPVYSVIRFL